MLNQCLEKGMVPRGGLRQFNQLNDLRKSGTVDLPTRSLCFLARLSHRRSPHPFSPLLTQSGRGEVRR